MLTRHEWAGRRDTLCEELALDLDPAAIIDQLAASSDVAWRCTAAGYADLRIEHRGERDEIVLTPLDPEAEPASLVILRTEVENLLPEVEIADLPLEVHGWTGFLDEYTHIGGTEQTREEGLIETLSALLVSESGSTPLPLAEPGAAGRWPPPTGCGSSSPVSTIHAAYNPRYFGRQRGSTLYSWMADTYTVFAQNRVVADGVHPGRSRPPRRQRIPAGPGRRGPAHPARAPHDQPGRPLPDHQPATRHGLRPLRID
jgi:hypothetical protein